MATGTSTVHCVKCGKERATFKCAGCLKDFCFNHLTDHRQELNVQLDEIEINRDVFRQTLNEQTINPKKDSLIKQIDKWEEDSIKIIQKTATQCRQIVLQYATKHINEMEIILNKLTDQLKQIRQENDFNEIHLNQFKEKLTLLAKELDKSSNILIQQDPIPLINKISVFVSFVPESHPVMQALQQRRDELTKRQQEALSRGDFSKARRMDRLSKQYQEAIDATRKGHPYDYSELPYILGFEPIPILQSKPQSSPSTTYQ